MVWALAWMGAHGAKAAQYEWTGASGSDLLWATPANWLPSGPPGVADDARLSDGGAAADTNTVSNIVGTSLRIRSLWVAPTNLFQNTEILPGVTLEVAGTAATPEPLYVGTRQDVDVATTVTSTFRGAGGSLSVSNPASALHVRQTHASAGAHQATLDMSGLDNFAADVQTFNVGVGDGTYRRAMGLLRLAKTNSIVVRGTYANPGLLVGDNSGNNNGNSSQSDLWLGQANSLQADYIRIGGQKQRGFMGFSPGFAPSSLVVRGSGGGTNRVTEWAIGDGSEQGASGNPTRGTVTLLDGSVDILANALLVGRGQTGTGRESEGFLSLGPGTLDVNTFDVAYQNAPTAAYRVDGTVNLFGTTTVVNDLLRLGRYAGSAVARNATLNLNGGSLSVSNRLACEGTVVLTVTNASLNLPPGSSILARTLIVDNGTINNAAVLSVTNSLIVANGGVISGSQVLDMGTDPACYWDFSSLAGGFTISNLLQGAGTLAGQVTLAPGATLKPGGAGVPGMLTSFNDLSIKDSRLEFDLSASGAGMNDQVSVYAGLSLQGLNQVALNSYEGSFDSAYTLFNYTTLSGGPANLQVVGPVAQSRYTFTFDTSVAGAVRLLVGGSGSANLTWVGDGSANLWDLQGAANWNKGGSADKFYNLDQVTFDDSGSAVPPVNLAGVLVPGSMTMANTTKDYVFGGTGSIGGGKLTLNGGGSVTVQNSGSNVFAAGIAVNAGSLRLAGASANDLESASLDVAYGASATVANTGENNFGPVINLYGTLAFEQSVDATLGANLTGTGTFLQRGPGVLTLRGDNNTMFFGPVQVVGGTLRVTAANNLPQTVGVVITNTGSLDVNGVNLDILPVTVSGAGAGGQGAIVNNSGNPAFLGVNLRYVTMAADTTFGGTGRWDLRSPAGSTGDPITAGLSTGGQPFNLTKVGPNGVYIVSATVDPALADITVKQGTLAFEGNTTSMGDPAKTLTVEAGAMLQFYRTTNLWDKKIVLNGTGTNLTVNNASWTNRLIAPITLHGACIFNAGGDLLILNGPVGGDGSLIKAGGTTLILGAANNYTGETTVSNGTLVVDGQIQASSGVTVAGGTLAGIGTITAPVSVNAGGAVSPAGAAIGTLTVAGALNLGGVARMNVDKAGASLTSDLIQGVTTLTYGGALELTLTGDPLAAGDQFKLFDAATYAGSFGAIVPATPGAGLAWDVSSLATAGTLKVIVAPPPSPKIGAVLLAGSNLQISGGGGPPGATYYVLGSTNVGAPLSLWVPVLTNNFDGSGNFTATLPVVPGTPRQFYLLQLP